jgi:pyruvate, orthophosphate dikinase
LRYVHLFSENINDKLRLGNKGGNLVTMTKIGLPIPPGFIISIDAYKQWMETKLLPEEEIREALSILEEKIGRKMGEGLEVSVRSSAPVSMPGMMDTILNIGDYSKMTSAIKSIFESWDSMRAIEYRRLNNISSTLGTSAVVQAMVYGNKDNSSGTGVVFTRNPSTGAKGLFGEYLSKAQGEDLVSGIRTPAPIEKLRQTMPSVYKELDSLGKKLEGYFRDMQDIEFTIESGKLYLLQTRNGKRSGYAAVKVAVDMVNENTITMEEAIMRVTVADIRGMLHKQLKDPSMYKVLVKGLNAAPGAVGGKVAFDITAVQQMTNKGLPTILVRAETSPDDIQGIAAANGVLTQKGGLTSHAAIVTRAMGKPCVCGAEEINIDHELKQFTCGEQTVKEGDDITIDGSSGNVYIGLLPVEDVGLTAELDTLLAWCGGFKRLGIRANADTPGMIAQAQQFGAEGIGLCRTERMFNAPERLSVIREFILARNEKERRVALDELQVLQTKDFGALFRELKGLPIIIRLLDLPLHEFLPHEDQVDDPHIRQQIASLRETNPMLGHRGVRLAVTVPELYQMQIAAIQQALQDVPANVSIMIPQVTTAKETLLIKDMLKGVNLRFGVMLETVRACMRAGRLAEVVDFFSFGTNDLTQAVFSFSREDAEKKFLSSYLRLGILQHNPFETLDTKGVGRLMETALFWARRSKPGVEVGVCGEQAAEPDSVRYLHNILVDYVSCSPFRIPTAKLVAAQAAIHERRNSPLQEVSELEPTAPSP